MKAFHSLSQREVLALAMLVRPLGLDVVRQQASAIEVETRRFYERAAARAMMALSPGEVIPLFVDWSAGP